VEQHVVTAIHHVQLAMPAGAEDRADAFYAGVLGMPRIPKPPELERRGGCWFGGDGFEVHLGVEAPFTPARKAHPAFVVDDLDAVQAALASAGFDVVEDTQLEGFERVYTSDPFGNRIEILAPTRS
jgi:catechol 2,3-dioxygenase-like lactoylglutathione lyase family enzyme